MTLAVILLILLALFFDFLNGFHDAANSIATIVSTRVMSPKYAVMWAAFFNFVAFFLFSHHTVASTLGKGIIDINIVDTYIIFATLFSACAWNLITWYLGLPTSSSHALMGGLVGSALVKVGTPGLIYKGIIKTVAFIVVAPVLGLLLGLVLGIIVYWVFRKKTPMGVDGFFRKAQLLSAATYSLGHGGNDAQKTMGIIASLLFSAGYHSSNFVPAWVAVSCYAAIAIGTLSGGWRIVKTMGQGITKLRPVDGFCAESGAAISLFAATALGIPVSTTHTITGSIVGVGSLRRLSAVRWGVAGRIVWAWIFTIPAAAIISAAAYYLSVKLL